MSRIRRLRKSNLDSNLNTFTETISLGIAYKCELLHVNRTTLCHSSQIDMHTHATYFITL